MLKGKTAVITGGSRGIGAAICEKLASYGVNVAVIYNGSEQKALEVKEKTLKLGVVSECFKCNVADFEECKKTAADITEKFGGVDILVNNAGITRDNLIISMSEEEFDSVINTNLKGCFNMIKALSRNFIKRKYGKIINISSVSALMGLAGQANYSASKAGIIALTKSVARELASRNIRCNAIAPGFITTDMTANLQNDSIIQQIPLKKCGTPEDVANLAAFLADDISDYITGEVIRIDGGLAM